MSIVPPKRPGIKKLRIWVDGCFDMAHWGHANLLRQAKQLGDVLVVGVHSSAEIEKNKGPTVMTDEERYAAVRACKWVDEVVEDAPYYTSMELCESLNIDIIVHGDDVSVGADGTDTYAAAKAAGKFQTVPRTIGVSSTDLVGRMLLLTREHHTKDDQIGEDAEAEEPKTNKSRRDSFSESAPQTCVSKFVPSTRRIVQFSDRREPKPDDKIVYVDGGFDMFHIGHIEFLKEARKQGTYVICGVIGDQAMNKLKGDNYPIMNIHERTLGVLSCRYVDEVIIGAPMIITKQFIEDLNINVVVHGTQYETASEAKYEGQDPYGVPKEMGIFVTVKSPSSLTTSGLVERILENRAAYMKRQKEKYAKEAVINKK